MLTLQDKIRGSLIGGAIGDAQGYPVEFCNDTGLQSFSFLETTKPCIVTF